MSGPALEVRVRHRVHPGLTLDLELTLDRACGILFGASGAGKTTLLRLIAGLERPDSGRVVLEGTTLFDSERRVDRPLRTRRIGMIDQHDLLFPHRSVAGNLRFGLHGWPRREADARVAEVAALCGVGHLLGRRPETLSGGERQRVGLARALAPRPRLLLCDEPVSALDLEGRHALIARLAEARRAEGIAMLHVTHSPAEALALGSHLFLVEGGRLVAEGPPLDLLGRAQAGPAADWSGARNVFAATVEEHAPDGAASVLRLAGDGPRLVVPRLDRPPGSGLTVGVRAEEILLAVGPIAGLSARNVIPGRVARVVVHGHEAEVVVEVGGTTWVVSLVEPAVAALGLNPGAEVQMIIKARSCRVLEAGPE